MRMPNGKGKFVTRDECQGAMSRVTADIETVKRALIGKDLRGGLVKDVADLGAKIDHIHTIIGENRRCSEIRLRWKLAIFGTAVSTIVTIICFIIKAAGG